MSQTAMILVVSPEEACRILNGDQSLLVRKLKPKCKLSIIVYIYCLRDAKSKLMRWTFVNEDTGVKEERFIVLHECCYGRELNDKVVAKFTLKEVEKINAYSILDTLYETKNQNIKQEELLKLSCLTYQELNAYLKHKIGYAWHIDNLVVFDKPLKLNDFHKIGYNAEMKKFGETIGETPKGLMFERYCTLLAYQLNQPPKTYCFVE